MKKENFGFSMPIHSPLYPEPPYDYDAEFVTVIYNVSQENLKRIIPEPLVVSPTGIVSCWIAYYPKVSKLAPYHESLFLVGVLYKETYGLYCPFIYVSTDEALAAGREIWGFPKKLAEMELKLEDDKVNGWVLRKNKRILEIELKIKGEVTLPELPMGDIYLLKQIPSVDGKKFDRILTATTMENLNFSSLKGGEVKVNIQMSDDDPTYLLQPENIITAVYAKGNMSLPKGRVVEVL